MDLMLKIKLPAHYDATFNDFFLAAQQHVPQLTKDVFVSGMICQALDQWEQLPSDEPKLEPKQKDLI